LLALLDDERFAVRNRAIDVLSQRGDAAIADLEKVMLDEARPVRARRNAVWALCRMPTSASRATSRKALHDTDATVREAAVHAVFCHRDQEALAALLPLLADPSSSVRRETATALGALKLPGAMPALLAALAGDNDRLLEHALIYALIEISNIQALTIGLAHASPRVRRGALIALDQMDGGELTSAQVLPLLGSPDPSLERTALEVVSKHKTWGKEIVGVLGRMLEDPQVSATRLEGLRGALAAFSGDGSVQKMIADTLSRPDVTPATRLLLLEVMARSDISSWPEPWRKELDRSLHSSSSQEMSQAIAAAAASSLRQFDRRLQELASDPKLSPELRVAAAAVVAGNGETMFPAIFQLLVEQCSDKVRPVERLVAARALTAARLSSGQCRQMAGLLAHADPLLLPALVDVLDKQRDRETGLILVAALAQAPGLKNLSGTRLERLLTNYPDEVRQAARPLLEQFNAHAAGQLQRLQELGKVVLTGGDPKRGRTVFRDNRALCITCHRIGSEGDSIGPDLSRIGATRTPADLLEAIVVPSASFARGFEPFIVSTTKGQIHAGIISRQTSDAVFLRKADRSEVRIPRSEVEEVTPSKESIMPKGLDGILTTEEMRDLIAYLASLKAEPR
jgi:putative heme-binding domain-containing protein